MEEMRDGWRGAPGRTVCVCVFVCVCVCVCISVYMCVLQACVLNGRI